jgi:hypothetical protein
MGQEFLTPYALHKRWGGAISPKTLANWRVKGLGPRWQKMGGRVVYALEAVLDYEKAQGMGRSLSKTASAVWLTACFLTSDIKKAYLSAVMVGFA